MRVCECLSSNAKIIQYTEPLAKFGEVNATTTAAEADLYGSLITSKQGGRYQKLINTGTIDRYKPLWGEIKMVHKGQKVLTPFLPLKNAIINARRVAMYEAPKIIFAKIARTCEAVIDIKGEFASLNTNCFYMPKAGVSLKYIGGVCNSKMFMYLYNLFFGALRMSGGYYQFQAPQLRVMPIPCANSNQQKAVETLVDQIMKKKMANSNTNDLEKEIDLIVYSLYGLSSDEISNIEIIMD